MVSVSGSNPIPPQQPITPPPGQPNPVEQEAGQVAAEQAEADAPPAEGADAADEAAPAGAPAEVDGGESPIEGEKTEPKAMEISKELQNALVNDADVESYIDAALKDGKVDSDDKEAIKHLRTALEKVANQDGVLSDDEKSLINSLDNTGWFGTNDQIVEDNLRNIVQIRNELRSRVASNNEGETLEANQLNFDLSLTTQDGVSGFLGGQQERVLRLTDLNVDAPTENARAEQEKLVESQALLDSNVPLQEARDQAYQEALGPLTNLQASLTSENLSPELEAQSQVLNEKITAFRESQNPQSFMELEQELQSFNEAAQKPGAITNTDFMNQLSLANTTVNAARYKSELFTKSTSTPPPSSGHSLDSRQSLADLDITDLGKDAQTIITQVRENPSLYPNVNTERLETLLDELVTTDEHGEMSARQPITADTLNTINSIGAELEQIKTQAGLSGNTIDQSIGQLAAGSTDSQTNETLATIAQFPELAQHAKMLSQLSQENNAAMLEAILAGDTASIERYYEENSEALVNKYFSSTFGSYSLLSLGLPILNPLGFASTLGTGLYSSTADLASAGGTFGTASGPLDLSSGLGQSSPTSNNVFGYSSDLYSTGAAVPDGTTDVDFGVNLDLETPVLPTGDDMQLWNAPEAQVKQLMEFLQSNPAALEAVRNQAGTLEADLQNTETGQQILDKVEAQSEFNRILNGSTSSISQAASSATKLITTRNATQTSLTRAQEALGAAINEANSETAQQILQEQLAQVNTAITRMQNGEDIGDLKQVNTVLRTVANTEFGTLSGHLAEQANRAAIQREIAPLAKQLQEAQQNGAFESLLEKLPADQQEQMQAVLEQSQSTGGFEQLSEAIMNGTIPPEFTPVIKDFMGAMVGLTDIALQPDSTAEDIARYMSTPREGEILTAPPAQLLQDASKLTETIEGIKSQYGVSDAAAQDAVRAALSSTSTLLRESKVNNQPVDTQMLLSTLEANLVEQIDSAQFSDLINSWMEQPSTPSTAPTEEVPFPTATANISSQTLAATRDLVINANTSSPSLNAKLRSLVSTQGVGNIGDLGQVQEALGELTPTENAALTGAYANEIREEISNLRNLPLSPGAAALRDAKIESLEGLERYFRAEQAQFVDDQANLDSSRIEAAAAGRTAISVVSETTGLNDSQSAAFLLGPLVGQRPPDRSALVGRLASLQGMSDEELRVELHEAGADNVSDADLLKIRGGMAHMANASVPPNPALSAASEAFSSLSMKILSGQASVSGEELSELQEAYQTLRAKPNPTQADIEVFLAQVSEIDSASGTHARVMTDATQDFTTAQDNLTDSIPMPNQVAALTGYRSVHSDDPPPGTTNDNHDVPGANSGPGTTGDNISPAVTPESSVPPPSGDVDANPSGSSSTDLANASIDGWAGSLYDAYDNGGGHSGDLPPGQDYPGSTFIANGAHSPIEFVGDVSEEDVVALVDSTVSSVTNLGQTYLNLSDSEKASLAEDPIVKMLNDSFEESTRRRLERLRESTETTNRNAEEMQAGYAQMLSGMSDFERIAQENPGALQELNAAEARARQNATDQNVAAMVAEADRLGNELILAPVPKTSGSEFLSDLISDFLESIRELDYETRKIIMANLAQEMMNNTITAFYKNKQDESQEHHEAALQAIAENFKQRIQSTIESSMASAAGTSDQAVASISGQVSQEVVSGQMNQVQIQETMRDMVSAARAGGMPIANSSEAQILALTERIIDLAGAAYTPSLDDDREALLGIQTSLN